MGLKQHKGEHQVRYDDGMTPDQTVTDGAELTAKVSVPGHYRPRRQGGNGARGDRTAAERALTLHRHARPRAGHPRLVRRKFEDVDGRDKPGHDDF